MKTKQIFKVLVGFFIFLGTISCNVSKNDGQESATPYEENLQLEKDAMIKKVNEASTSSQKQVSYEEFKKMSIEEKWRSFSPQRRNWIRERIKRYPDYQKMVDAEPDMEPEN